jgi:hypothetical protein
MNRMFNAVQGNIIEEGDPVDITLKVGHDESDRVSSSLDPLLTLDQDKQRVPLYTHYVNASEEEGLPRSGIDTEHILSP